MDLSIWIWAQNEADFQSRSIVTPSDFDTQTDLLLLSNMISFF